MEAPHVYIAHFNGYDVECYGTLEETSNFSIVCAYEWDDRTWCDGITGALTWENVLAELQPHFKSAIWEITAV